MNTLTSTAISQRSQVSVAGTARGARSPVGVNRETFNKSHSAENVKGFSKESGAILLTGLIMLLLMTIVGLAAVRGSALQELMAGNMRESMSSFQAAEAALSEIEETVAPMDWQTLRFDGTESAYVDLTQPGKSRVGNWTQSDWNSAPEVGVDVPRISKKPRYVVEKLEAIPVADDDFDGSGIGGNSRREAPLFVFLRVSVSSYGVGSDSWSVIQSTIGPQIESQ